MIRWTWALLALRALAVNASTIECVVSVACGLGLSGQPLVEHDYRCIDVRTGKTLLFDTKFTNERFQELAQSSDDESVPELWLSVPIEAVDEDTGLIHGDDEGITLASNNAFRLMDPAESERLGIARLPSKLGDQRVLLVVASDNAGHYVEHDRATLIKEYFGAKDGRDLSLKSILNDCTGGQLRILPATGPGNGVLDVAFDYNFETRNNGSPESWRDLGQKMYERVKDKGLRLGVNYDAVFFIMPDIVSFSGAAAFAAINGFQIWIRSQYALMPIAQVHEYGHLLGLSHSGKGVSSYGDPTCYMSNRVPWDSYGLSMCYNSAKIWQLGWYDQFNTRIEPLRGELFDGELMGLHDAAKSIDKGRKLVVRVGGQIPLYIMFNRKIGINSGQFESVDSVIITEQDNSYTDSFYRGEVSPGKSWSEDNFAGSGKKLIVKFCSYSDQKNTVKILVYLEGGSTTPRCGDNGDCSDDRAWSVGKGNSVDQTEKPCSWFNVKPSVRCNGWWSKQLSNGKTAKQACCSCGHDAITSLSNGSDGSTSDADGEVL